jgi:hypothetical protein
MSIDDIPVFGKGPKDETRPVGIEVYDTIDAANEVVKFLTYIDPGSGVVLSFMRAKTQDQKLAAATRVVYSALVDTDGLSLDFDGTVEEDPRLTDREQWSSRRRFAFFVESDRYRILSTVIEELAEWSVREAFAGRPTGRPSA